MIHLEYKEAMTMVDEWLQSREVRWKWRSLFNCTVLTRKSSLQDHSEVSLTSNITSFPPDDTLSVTAHDCAAFATLIRTSPVQLRAMWGEDTDQDACPSLSLRVPDAHVSGRSAMRLFTFPACKFSKICGKSSNLPVSTCGRSFPLDINVKHSRRSSMVPP